MKNTNITKKDSNFIKELFLRFKILLSCIEWNNNFILDVWCGIWDFNII